MPSFKPAYLIHGDDHGRIGERRARLRAIAEGQGGAQGVELLEGEASNPDAVAAALSAMTFALGRRFLVVDGVERWKDKDLAGLEAAMASMPPDTTVAFFAREEGRTKAPARLVAAVKKAGGDIAQEATVKPWELPKWVAARARELGLELEGGAARALVVHVGDRQQRLLRELEKLALELGPGGQVGLNEIEERTAPSAELRAWTLADALVAGEEAEATRAYLALRAQGERLSGLLYMIAQRLRAALEVARALEAGASAAEIKRGLRMPSRAADRLISDVGRTGSERLRRALESVADLEVSSRGGGSGGAGEDTQALLAIAKIAA
ncbi:MAG TPA: DNA polymerase III subunit delta [Solirubrobacteraceae bacterium]|nr:DNA polymerase III subunit delta [Solirubrobacteraceae bacterium]